MVLLLRDDEQRERERDEEFYTPFGHDRFPLFPIPILELLKKDY